MPDPKAEERARLTARLRALPSPGAGDSNGAEEPPAKPVFNIGDQDLERGTMAAWDAVTRANDPPTLFVYGGLPTRIDRDETTGVSSPRVMDVDRMRNRLGRVATFVRTTAKGAIVSARPPVATVRDMLADSTYPLPTLRAITEVPTFGPDGTLPSVPGYHEPGQTYYAPAEGFVVPAIPDAPTQAQIVAARSLLIDDLMGDFPFTGEPELAHALTLLLQSFARNLIVGPTPLYLFEKPSPGTGATLLVDMISLIATGRSASAMTEGRDEDEMRKRLTAALLDGPPMIFFDNLRRRLDYSCLAAAITETTWKDRILGTSGIIRLPIQNAWVATGNNPALSSEMTRRTVRSRLDAKVDQPWLRTKFHHHNLREWTTMHRGDLVAACLTLARAWIHAGKPNSAHGRSIGMFESWASVMGGMLDVADVPGFLANSAEFYARSDTEGADIRSFLIAWWEEHRSTPVKVSTLFTIATAADSTLDITAKTEQGQRVRLGSLLAQIEGRHYELEERLTVRVTRSDKKDRRAVLWQLTYEENDESNDKDSRQDSPDTENQSPHNNDEYDPFSESVSLGESITRYEEISINKKKNSYTGGAEKTHSDSPDSPFDRSATRTCVDCGAPLSDDRDGFYCENHGQESSPDESEYDPWQD